MLYREGESLYGMRAVLATVKEPPAATDAFVRASFVWFRVAGHVVLARQLDDEGIEWARVTEVQAEAGVWTDVVPALLAARRLAGTGE